MTQRDWDKELAKIDRQLASLPDDELVTTAPSVPGTGMPRGVAAGPSRIAAPGAAPMVGATSGKARLWSYTKLAVAVAGAVGLWFWPWPARCGMPLAGLVAAGGGVALLGLWSAFGTWRQRLGYAHVLSLLVIVSAAVLVGREVMPRIGYAQPTFDRPAQWSCQAAAPSTVPSTLPVAPSGPTTL